MMISRTFKYIPLILNAIMALPLVLIFLLTFIHDVVYGYLKFQSLLELGLLGFVPLCFSAVTMGLAFHRRWMVWIGSVPILLVAIVCVLLFLVIGPTFERSDQDWVNVSILGIYGGVIIIALQVWSMITVHRYALPQPSQSEKQ